MDTAYIDASDEGSKTVSVFFGTTTNPPQQYSSLAGLLGGLPSRPSYVLIPEQERGAVISGLDAASRTTILSYVSNGGTLVVVSMGDPNSLSMQNQLFGWRLSSADCNSVSTSLDVKQASGTVFSTGPSTLPPLNAVQCVSMSSLPTGSQSIYYSSSAVSVFQVAVGTGRVIGLAPDWFSTSSEWNSVLIRALQQAQAVTVCKGLCQAGTYWTGSGSHGNGVVDKEATACQDDIDLHT
jgi:hypothetical protein